MRIIFVKIGESVLKKKLGGVPDSLAGYIDKRITINKETAERNPCGFCYSIIIRKEFHYGNATTN